VRYRQGRGPVQKSRSLRRRGEEFEGCQGGKSSHRRKGKIATLFGKKTKPKGKKNEIRPINPAKQGVEGKEERGREESRERQESKGVSRRGGRSAEADRRGRETPKTRQSLGRLAALQEGTGSRKRGIREKNLT